ncbi:TetR/AcrR family transcriptional regulator [Enterococcus hirae]|jgi:AcrR family transcriptional regulator|nr:TetR/AcrR family transcriptional regulator [Enterococcaceae bacterium]MDM8213507.1 TetR/AcrR family transcriptional regulator [Enterococcus hirae]
MARKKTITKEQILDAAYNLVKNEGFSRFTARNIASTMGCSTQPIYLEFKNMEDLRRALFEKIYHYLGNEVYPTPHTGDPLIDLGLNYINFANTERRLYRSLFLEEYGGGAAMQKFSLEYFFEHIPKGERYQELNEKDLQALHEGNWIVATGIASLMSSRIIAPTDDQIIQLLEESIISIAKLYDFKLAKPFDRE